MIDTFLKAKHWQIFLLTFGIPILLQIVVMGFLISSFTSNPNVAADTLFGYMKFLPLVMMLFMSILFGWLWSVAVGLQNKIPENIKMKVTKFKAFFFIPLVYILFILIVFAGFSESLFSINTENNTRFHVGIFVAIFLMHVFSIFCMFYTLYFVAKTFKTTELQRQVTFSDFAGEFFLIWFFPIGIWILQPKINKMIED